jgi:hypothetical protein
MDSQRCLPYAKDRTDHGRTQWQGTVYQIQHSIRVPQHTHQREGPLESGLQNPLQTVPVTVRRDRGSKRASFGLAICCGKSDKTSNTK